MNTTSLERALKAVGGGRKTDIAALLGISPAAVTRWKDVVPVNRAIEIEEKTGGKVTRYDLRPDIFGAAPRKRRGAAA